MAHIVNAVFVHDGRVLLTRRSAHRKNYANMWSFPGGHVEQGETLKQALTREVAEETTAHPMAYEKITAFSDPADPTITYHIYMVTDWIGTKIALRGSEHSEARWFAMADAMALTDLAVPSYRDIFALLDGT